MRAEPPLWLVILVVVVAGVERTERGVGRDVSIARNVGPETAWVGLSLRCAAGLSSFLARPALARAQRPGCWRTRDGCVVQLLVNVDENGVVFDLAGVNRDGATGKHTDSLPGGQVVA
jgi:hypothetical protein